MLGSFRTTCQRQICDGTHTQPKGMRTVKLLIRSAGLAAGRDGVAPSTCPLEGNGPMELGVRRRHTISIQHDHFVVAVNHHRWSNAKRNPLSARDA